MCSYIAETVPPTSGLTPGVAVPDIEVTPGTENVAQPTLTEAAFSPSARADPAVATSRGRARTDRIQLRL